MFERILLVTPPLIQPNTPYPATLYLKGFLNTKNVDSRQIDLSLETLLSIFSKSGLEQLFKEVSTKKDYLSDNALRIYSLSLDYISTIDIVISFLQGKEQTMAQMICDDQFLPQASRFENTADLYSAFGEMGYRDKARHYATLYIEDLCDFITETVDSKFGFSRYAESLGRCASSFDEIYDTLKRESFTDKVMLDILDKHIKEYNPDMVAISIPFPGNLYSALRCGGYIKKRFPKIKVEMGGGFVNTELRSLSDIRVFEFTDFITLDDGELPLLRLIEAMKQTEFSTNNLIRTFLVDDDKVKFMNCDTGKSNVTMSETGTPDYSDLSLESYLSLIDVINPMHKLWSDGRWNKMTLAHGCYWGKCSFCDCSLDYISRYDPLSAKIIVDRIQEIVQKTGESGFHFVDEAAPPILLKEMALELLNRGVNITWWTNVRFEKTYTADLCRLLKASGCIAVAGGLEVASDRILKLINKGVTVEQVAKVAHSFTESGIMVHAYLMYGFPSQSEQETINSLEVVRQLFECKIVSSGFWHRFALTAHSPVCKDPDRFAIKENESDFGGFADNDRFYNDLHGAKHEKFGEGLRKSLYNYMHDIGLDYPLQDWFSFGIPKPQVAKSLIYKAINSRESFENLLKRELIWIGGEPIKREIKKRNGKSINQLIINNRTDVVELTETSDICNILYDMIYRCKIRGNTKYVSGISDKKYRLKDLQKEIGRAHV